MYTGENNMNFNNAPIIYFDQQLYQPRSVINPKQITNLKLTDIVQLDDIRQFSNLIELDCSNINIIGKLPKLPDGIQKLQCRENQITELPNKMDSIIFLDCCYNNIKKIPKYKNLKHIIVDKNVDISNVHNNKNIYIQIIDEEEIRDIFGDSFEFGHRNYYGF